MHVKPRRPQSRCDGPDWNTAGTPGAADRCPGIMPPLPPVWDCAERRERARRWPLASASLPSLQSHSNFSFIDALLVSLLVDIPEGISLCPVHGPSPMTIVFRSTPGRIIRMRVRRREGEGSQDELLVLVLAAIMRNATRLIGTWIPDVHKSSSKAFPRGIALVIGEFGRLEARSRERESEVAVLELSHQPMTENRWLGRRTRPYAICAPVTHVQLVSRAGGDVLGERAPARLANVRQYWRSLLAHRDTRSCSYLDVGQEEDPSHKHYVNNSDLDIGVGHFGYHSSFEVEQPTQHIRVTAPAMLPSLPVETWAERVGRRPSVLVGSQKECTTYETMGGGDKG
ncbi:hypothetical protein FIBSPDRAFT_936288 [Athelia psychrophila]|uniref:Uncharacterized protein n=1 Tax=Athelia psychrophila TaxID=1759441 RepID=A0A166CE17_9AGAM|nr:hypothetical protein FIBSPDRAFT_936288 [Fibularhizoctonia sp. CBS 109695]